MKHFYKLFATTALFCAFSGFAGAQTTIPSVVSGTQTWDASGNPYLVTANVLVEKGAKVTILPGVVIKSKDNLRIIVDGELVAQGKKDSVITMDTVSFEFTSQSVGYDFAAGTGSNFKYCYFRGNPYNAAKTIALDKVNMFVSNCKFYCTYFTFYGMNSYYDSSLLRIEKSIFDGGSYGYGYIMMVTGKNSFVEMDECSVRSMSGLNFANYISITRCTFYDWKTNSGIRINAGSSFYPSNVYISCNSFLKFPNSILDMYGISATEKVTITNNTFDSANYFIDCYLTSNSNKVNKLLVENNNFLYYKQKSINMHGGNNPGKADSINFRNNYWGTTTASQIEDGIYDFKDDITVVVKVDFGSFLSSKQTQCIPQNPGSTNSVKDLAKTEFSLMPNPASSMVKVITPETGLKTIRIYDLSGKVLSTETMNGNEIVLDCNRLSNGLYIVEVAANGKQSHNQKLLVSK